MDRQTLPRALFTTLVAAAAAAQPAAALPPDSSQPSVLQAPARPQLVDDATLAEVSGKYFGADMLVGLRIDLVSHVAASDGGTATAQGTLSIQRNGSGFDVRVDTRSAASAGSGAAGVAPDAGAHGGEAVQVGGISQIAQIAGDGNRLGNLAVIRFAPVGGDTGDYNGQARSQSWAGGMSAQVSFLDGALSLGVGGGGANLTQQVQGGDGGIAQLGQLSGNGLTGSNLLRLTLATRAMPLQVQQQLGVQQALSGLVPLGR